MLINTAVVALIVIVLIVCVERIINLYNRPPYPTMISMSPWFVLLVAAMWFAYAVDFPVRVERAVLEIIYLVRSIA